MYFFTSKIEIYWQVVILLILDFLAWPVNLIKFSLLSSRAALHCVSKQISQDPLRPKSGRTQPRGRAAAGLAGNPCLLLGISALTLCYCFEHCRFTQLIEYSTRLKDFI